MTNLKIPQLTKELVDRFWLKVKLQPNGCWEWQGSLLGNGYGRFHAQYKSYYAHRLAYQIYYTVFPNSLYVCHHCDNKICVNPLHLFLGTALDNARDRISKGRPNWYPETVRAGMKNGNAKLTEAQVKEIKERCRRNELHSSIATAFNISKFTVDHISTGARWAHVI